MSDENASHGTDSLEIRRLELERYKAGLAYRKFIWGSVFAAIVITTIPPLFQYVKGEAERKLQAQQFRDGYVKDFLNTALNQDIEQRIRFAKYFSSVSSEKDDWARYRDDLTKLRDAKKLEIDGLELAWQKLADQSGTAADLKQAQRHLDWAYAEVGYAAPNRSAISRPSDESRGPGISLTSIVPAKRDMAQKILDAFAAAGLGQFQQVAALANAFADSNLNPNAASSPSEDSWGLFQLNRAGGLGVGRTPEELKNPDINIGIVVEQAKKQPAFVSATSLDEAVDIFVRRIDRPANVNGEVIKRQQIARQFFRS